MKTLLIGLLALTSATAFASSKEIINCSSKYETFTVTVENELNVVIERRFWERSVGMTSSKKVVAYSDKIQTFSDGIDFSINAREASQVSIRLALMPNNQNNILVTKITADNSEALETLNESLGITEESSIAFGQSECTITK